MDLKFVPFNSEIELPFYAALFQSKLDYDRLDDSARPLIGQYHPRAQLDAPVSAGMQILGNALTNRDKLPLGVARAEGTIRNINTIEGFRKVDKQALLQTAGRQIWDAINDGSIYSVPSLLSPFVILSYADLKKYRFTYWFCFPALHSSPPWKRVGPIGKLTARESAQLVDRVGTWRYTTDNREHGFFLAKKVPRMSQSLSPWSELSSSEDRDTTSSFIWKIGSLGEFETGFFDDVDDDQKFVAFLDPSNYPENPAWPIRNLLVLVRQRFRMTKVQILCLRDVHATRHEARSIILPLAMDEVETMELTRMPKLTGWERNRSGDLRPRVANLAEHMDPTRLADQAVDLNLKLMKWRIAPNLNLDAIKDTKCLLLGAGTLGSYVSRNLLGWGVCKITFVDYGSVSFSNPVRQPLFNFDDCLGGGKPKALQASEALRQIYPGVQSQGHAISVPMLGHPITDLDKTKADFDTLQDLIKDHDAVFLLMDTRESRWLPTVMGKAEGKIVLNAALGFDTFVVMRHGALPRDGGAEGPTLGCYFCNDVVAPTDSMKDQTLDQQCTVTRPGIAAMASALLVELLASILQHPLREHAPAPVPSTSATGQPSYNFDPPDHALGIVPHQIRGFLSTFQNMVIRGQSYDHCSACSEPILDAYRNEGWQFVQKALADDSYVTELSGLAEVQRGAEAAAAECSFSDGEDFSMDEGESVLVDAD